MLNTIQVKKSIFQKSAKVIRVLFIPPVMAILLVILLREIRGIFMGYWGLLACLFLALFPTTSYLICFAVPSLKEKGRETQRTVSVWFSLFSYLIGCGIFLAAHRPDAELWVMLTYVFSGFLISLFSFLCKTNASGHACGMSGPAMMLSAQVSPVFLLLYLLLIPVWRSSLELKRHTSAQLALGTLCPVAAMMIARMILGLTF